MLFGAAPTVSGTAAIVASSLSFLESYKNITAIDITDGDALSVSLKQFKAYEALLNKVSGGFEIEDTEASIKAAFITKGSKLVADTANIQSLVISNGATTALELTAARASTASKLLSKLGGSAIVDVEAATGARAATGDGDSLTIHDIAGIDTITGGGASEYFVFASHWGQATITDFSKHFETPGNDTIQLSKSEFAHGAITLLADAKSNAAGTAVIVTAGTDRLKLTGLTISELKAAINDGDFTFV
jgi:copper chaperone CopZ